MERRTLVLDVQLGAAVARTAFRIVRTVVVGVRRDRAALAVTHRAHQATGVHAVSGQVVVHGPGATLGQGLVVGIGTLLVVVASHLYRQRFLYVKFLSLRLYIVFRRLLTYILFLLFFSFLFFFSFFLYFFFF